MATKTVEQTILWLKAAQKRQQDWQQEVKTRWDEASFGHWSIQKEIEAL